jgi:hypothetical protein
MRGEEDELLGGRMVWGGGGVEGGVGGGGVEWLGGGGGVEKSIIYLSRVLCLSVCVYVCVCVCHNLCRNALLFF